MASDTYDIGGVTVTVANFTTRYLVATTKGIEVMVAPGRKWWCLWLCKRSTRKADSIVIEVRLFPPGSDGFDLTSRCTACAGLKAGHTYYGWLGLSGPDIAAMRYVVDIAIAGQQRRLTGEFVLL